MEAVEDFPYQAEYAKSSRASCRKCSGNIEKGSLRLAVLVQSPSFDGKVTQWYHYSCFFTKQKPKSVADIAHFDSLRWEDQKKIKEKIETGGGLPGPTGSKKGKKGQKVNGDFSVEYAKSGRAACKKCEEKIGKDVIRISKLNYESDTARRYGPVPMWHHVDCFLEVRNELEFYDSGDNIPGFNTLSADDKKMLRGKIKAVTGSCSEDTDSKRKSEDEPDTTIKKAKAEDDAAMKKQNTKLYYFRDLLEKNLEKSELAALLEHSDFSFIPTGESRILDTLADHMTFGVPQNCDVCKDGYFIYKFGIGYKCNGNLTEWTKCTNVVDAPKRKPFTVPEEFKEEVKFLKSYKFKDFGPRIVVKREIKPVPSTSNGKSMSSTKPLENMSFVLVGKKFTKDKKAIKDKITSLGGSLVTKVEKTTAAIITTSDMIDGKDKKISTAKELEIQCVSEDFLDEVEAGGAALMIKKKNMAPWGANPEERIYKTKSKPEKSGSRFTKSVPDKMKLQMKGGAVVDPDSNKADCGHIYQRDGKFYNCVLGLVNLQRGTNSYYKLQLIEHDNKNSFYIFRSWGRIGTTIGGNKIENCGNLHDAINAFCALYEEKTGQQFTDPVKQKLPGYWYPLDIDYGQDEDVKLDIKVEGGSSKLPLPVQHLVSLLFDVNRMKSTMVEFEIDLKKMPLGKLSSRQLENAYKVLSEALDWIAKKENKDDSQASAINNHLLDCSNRFYTLIPHDFGMNAPPLLDNEALIKSKIEMIDNLREIEIAYNLLKSEDAGGKELDPIDQHYRKLKTDIGVLDKESDEFKMIQKYVKNTHATTHSYYSLEINEVFKIDRSGELKRFKPFKKLHNHQLLWHGSRLTNFVGILSQGLRIAPPEAPVTGYMFGKGVYFADMVSKSANYCSTSSQNPTGLLMLCDVALGDMYELTNAKYVEKLPKGKHSTKGLGTTCPDSSQDVIIEDNIKVPLGKGIPSGVKSTSLLYNEYIVYDVAQINVKYLIQTSFKYNYGF